MTDETTADECDSETWTFGLSEKRRLARHGAVSGCSSPHGLIRRNAGKDREHAVPPAPVDPVTHQLDGEHTETWKPSSEEGKNARRKKRGLECTQQVGQDQACETSEQLKTDRRQELTEGCCSPIFGSGSQ